MNESAQSVYIGEGRGAGSSRQRSNDEDTHAHTASDMASNQLRAALALGLCLVALSFADAGVVAPGYYPNVTALKGSKDQSVTIGTINYQDRLLLQETAYKDSIWMMVRDADVLYPKKDEIGYKISCIKVLDQRKDGKNGEVKVKEGGLGSNFVKLRFHSQRGHSLNYVVQIYGR